MRVLEKNTASAAIISEAITAAAMSICWKRTGPPNIMMSVDALRQVQFGRDHLLRIAAEDHLAEADEEIGQPEGRHEQDDVRLVDERPQHDALDRDAPA